MPLLDGQVDGYKAVDDSVSLANIASHGDGRSESTQGARRQKIVVVGLGMVAISFM